MCEAYLLNQCNTSFVHYPTVLDKLNIFLTWMKSKGIINLYPAGNRGVFTKVYGIIKELSRHFTTNQKCPLAGGTKGEKSRDHQSH